MIEYFSEDTLRWLAKLAMVLLGAGILHWLLAKVFKRLQTVLHGRESSFDEDFVDSIRKPVFALWWLVAFAWSYDLIATRFNLPTAFVIDRLFYALFAVIVGWFMLRLIKNRENYHLGQPHGRFDETAIHAIAKVSRLIVTVLVAISTMQTLGVDASGIIAFGGISGAALAFASRDLLSNFFGGVIVYLDKPFKVGDWVRSSEQDIEGTVEYIGWRVTVIRTFDKRPLYVPNAVFARIGVENPSRMTHRRIYETIGIRYEDLGKMEEITEDIRSMLLQHEDIANDQTLIVNFDQFGPSSLDFFIYTFTKTTNWIEFHKVKQDVLLKVANIIESHGAEIAFPTQTVHLDSVPKELQTSA